MKPVSQLTEEERLQEIAALLVTAALRYLAAKQDSAPGTKRPTSKPVALVWDLVEDETEKQLLRYLSIHSAALPADMENALQLTNRTLSRHLSRLRGLGLVVVSGKTRNATYSLAGPTSKN